MIRVWTVVWRRGLNSAALIAMVLSSASFLAWLFHLGPTQWRLLAIAICFGGNALFCRTQTMQFNVLYTAGFSTLLWYVWFPFDLALANGAAQVACIAMTGMTVHDWLAQRINLWKGVG